MKSEQENRTGSGLKLNRIYALDLTRGIAVLGMMYMNFKITFSAGEWSPEYSFASAMEGRFGVLFIFLAGAGVALMNRKALALDDRNLLRENRLRLLKRSAFLYVTGMLFSLYWFADILHFYAFYLLIGLTIVSWKRWQLALLLPLPVVAFELLTLVIPWETGWDFAAFSYNSLYSPAGFFRNLLYNGFHPIFPWITFFILGMIVGKSNLEPSRKTGIGALIALAVFIGTELLSAHLISAMPSEELKIVVSSRSFPPFPLFVVSASAMALFILYSVILLSSRLNTKALICRSLAESGRMVMSHYLFHLLAGLPLLYLLAEVLPLSGAVVTVFTLLFFAGSLVLTMLWRRRFTFGPMETLMRKLSG